MHQNDILGDVASILDEDVAASTEYKYNLLRNRFKMTSSLRYSHDQLFRLERKLCNPFSPKEYLFSYQGSMYKLPMI